jgi:hypothetical protein
MSDQLEDEQKFRLQVLANEYLLRTALIRLMLLDLGFAKDARQWIDTIFGQVSTSEQAHTINPQSVNALREEYLRLLARAEHFAFSATASAKPKTIRRRIFEWFERG